MDFNAMLQDMMSFDKKHKRTFLSKTGTPIMTLLTSLNQSCVLTNHTWKMKHDRTYLNPIWAE